MCILPSIKHLSVANAHENIGITISFVFFLFLFFRDAALLFIYLLQFRLVISFAM